MIALRILVALIPFAFIAYSFRVLRREPYLAAVCFVAGIGLFLVLIVSVVTG